VGCSEPCNYGLITDLYISVLYNNTSVADIKVI